MTKQESFKRRVRERMEKTGERYARARQVLIEQAAPGRGRHWVAEPETSDQAVRAATGRGWDEWCDLIGRWPDRSDDHAAIASYVGTLDEVDQWWAQTITVGYERIIGLRLPYQRADGTFTAGKSATIHASADELRQLLLDDAARADLFPGKATRLRSQPTSKVIRVEIGPGVVDVSLDQKDDGRTRVAVAHEGLPSYEDVEPWKFYWSEWLEAIDNGA